MMSSRPRWSSREERRAMETEKIRNLNDEELVRQEKQSAEQLFRLRFQMKLGQNEGVKKLRDLRKDVARIKTIARGRAWGWKPAPVAVPTKTKRAKKGAREAMEEESSKPVSRRTEKVGSVVST